MRFFLAALVPALALSLSVIACSADANSDEPSTFNEQSQLVAVGGDCDDQNACQTGLTCGEPETTTKSLKIQGFPAPAPTTTTDPAPAPAPTTTSTTVTPPGPVVAPGKVQTVCLAPAK